VERAGEPALQLRILRRTCGRRGRCGEGDQRDEGCEEAAVQTESIF